MVDVDAKLPLLKGFKRDAKGMPKGMQTATAINAGMLISKVMPDDVGCMHMRVEGGAWGPPPQKRAGKQPRVPKTQQAYLLHDAGGNGSHQTAVQASRQQHSKGHVRHHALAHCCCERLTQDLQQQQQQQPHTRHVESVTAMARGY